MKVGLTSGSLSRDAGGLFESVRALGKGLAELKVDVSVYGLWDKNWDRDKKAWTPLSAHAFSFIGPRALAWAPEMDNALDEARPDILSLHGLWQYPSVATRRQLQRHGTRYVVSPRGMLDIWALANSRWKKRIAAWAFENAVLSDAACLHALCTPEADAIRAYGLKQRIEVVPNGVDLPEKLTTEHAESTEGKKRLLFLGRIHPKKGLVGALRAWAEIQKSKSKIHNSNQWQFVIAGWDQGGHEGELKRLCADLGLRSAECGEAEDLKLNSYKLKTERSLDLQGGLLPDNGSSRRLTLPDVDVVFFGPAFGEEKEALLRSAEAFILPSFSEGLPMSVLEAWAYGLPVVMTPECNLPEGFASGAALEIRSGEGSFQDGMRTLIEMTDQELAAMGMRGRRLVEERFTWPKVAAQMRRLYEEVLGR
jgi:poly(glycerol-phosphate) alpha-glucosyltransferase